jgi:hypothetical protein
MRSIDLHLQADDLADPITAFVVSAGGNHVFHVQAPSGLLAHYQAWRRRFLAHHDPGGPPIGSDVVGIYGQQLCQALAEWFDQPAWLPLRQVLAAEPSMPLRLRCEERSGVLERLPWETLPLGRPIWRLAPAGTAAATGPAAVRQPRLLLLLGDETSLSLGEEIARLEALRSKGRIQLVTLRGTGCREAAIRSALIDPQGWDGVIFLGHSDADPAGGGRLHLGDGSWLAAHALQADLTAAAGRGLNLALLNSCSGIDLARGFTTAGIGWVLCFRDPVPSQAASQAFTTLLSALENGRALPNAVLEARRQLEMNGPAGTPLLLSLYTAPGASSFVLPLRRRRVFLLRLASSRPGQLAAATLAVSLGVVSDLVPSNPIDTALLNGRLQLQRDWRKRTGQGGPRGEALPVFLLDERRSEATLDVRPGDSLVSRAALAEILRRTSPSKVPRVGLDVVLDQVGPDAAGMAALVRVIGEQRRPQVFAGYFGADTEAPQAGDDSRPIAPLRAAGLQAYNLSVGTAPGGDSSLKPPPLRLLHAIDSRHFAHALAGSSARTLPADAVIDWSIDWVPLIQKIRTDDLPALRTPVLLVGDDGYRGEQRSDRFMAPLAVQTTLPRWGGSSADMPGVLVQAVLAQSLRLGWWLAPASVACTTALASGLGVVVAAASARPLRQAGAIGAILLITIPVSFQMAVSFGVLVPILLPLAGLSATALLRRS